MERETIQFVGKDLVEHEEMLLRCLDQRNIKLLVELSLSDVEEDDNEWVITDTRPTIVLN